MGTSICLIFMRQMSHDAGTVREPADPKLNFFFSTSAPCGDFLNGTHLPRLAEMEGSAPAQFRLIRLRWIGSAITYMKWMVGTA
jgi:hypothetical protein